MSITPKKINTDKIRVIGNPMELRTKAVIALISKIQMKDPSEIERSEHLSEYKRIFSAIPYLQLIKPLVVIDRTNKLSWKQLGTKYGISSMQARLIIINNSKFKG